MTFDKYMEKKVRVFSKAWYDLQEKIAECCKNPEFDIESDSVTVRFDDDRFDLSLHQNREYFLWRNTENSEDDNSDPICSIPFTEKEALYAVMTRMFNAYLGALFNDLVANEDL